MEISFHSHLDSNTVIATKFCTWHDSCAVVACAKNCCDPMASNGVMARQSFHRIWIAGEQPLVKRAPGWLHSSLRGTIYLFHMLLFPVFIFINSYESEWQTPPFLKQSYFKILPWKSKVTVIGGVRYQGHSESNITSFHVPFLPCQSDPSISETWPDIQEGQNMMY